MSETDLQSSIMAALRQLGFWVARTNAGQINNVQLLEPGTPDLLLIAPVYGWIEVKLPKEELNANQRKWHARAARSGVRVAIAHSVSEAVNQAISWRASQPLATGRRT